jgi:crotonobetainyl-CoA:carnitine CoA-transferase CaiB-like acyl-CoA transferase
MSDADFKSRPPVKGPLAGLRILDMTTSYAGPTASMYLADLGADVIKVEKSVTGDDARGWGPPFVGGTSAWFASANRNKRSIGINLRTPQGLETLYDLIRASDVFMESFNPAKLVRLGIDPGTLHSLNPRLIYCAMSGFGLDGPASDQPGYDLAAQARSGLMSVTGAKCGSPQRVSTALSDIVTGMNAALAICAAAVPQRTQGVGDLIDVSLLDSNLALMAPRIASYLAGEPEPAPSGGTDSVLAVYQTFPTASRDIVVAIGNDAMWARFCKVLGLEGLAEDESLATNAGRRENRPRIIEVIGARMKNKTAEEWREELHEANVPTSFVQFLHEVVEDEQVIARDALLPVQGNEGLYSVHSPFRLRSIPTPRNEPLPGFAEHSREILEQIGLSTDRINELVKSGAITQASEQKAEVGSRA